MMSDTTKVWVHPITGHQYEEGERGNLLNGVPSERPEWVSGVAFSEFGPVLAWGGGECPVDPSAIVRCFFRGRRPYVGEALFSGLSDAAKGAMWHHAPYGPRICPSYDIVGYQEALSNG